MVLLFHKLNDFTKLTHKDLIQQTSGKDLMDVLEESML